MLSSPIPQIGAMPAPPTEDTKTRRGRYVFLILMPFLMVTMMFATYMGTMHNPEPNGMPVAVVGDGGSTQTWVDSLSATDDGALSARSAATADDAVGLIEDGDIVGAIVPPGEPGEPATIFTATAAGASQAMTTQQLLGAFAVQKDWTVVTQDIAPLPEGDASGTVVLFAAMGMMLSGYVPLSLILLGAPYLLAMRRFLPLALSWAVGCSSLIWLILGPIVGAVDGHALTFVGLGTLAILAVGMTQLLFIRIMGPLAVLLGMLLFVVFGMPAANLALSIHTMPGFFSFLNGILPLPAAGEALRAYLYFDGNGATGHFVTLAIWALVGFALSLLIERRKGVLAPGAPRVTDPEVPLPALSGSPLRSKQVRYAALAAFPLAILVLVVGLMGFSMHSPELRDLPVTVVAASSTEAAGLADGLTAEMGGIAEVNSTDNVDEALDSLRDQDVTGVYVLPTAPGEPATLYISSGAGASQVSAVTSIFQNVAAESGYTVVTEDVTPLTSSDTMGSNSLYVGMSWMMAGFLMLAVLRGGAPEMTRFRSMLPMLGGWSVGMAIWLWFLFDILIGAVTGHAFALIACGAVTILCVSMVTAVFTRTLGLAAIVPVMVLVMLAGVPASGGGMSIYMVPEVFRWLQGFLMLPAAVDVARSLVYFDNQGVVWSMVVIVIWGAIGLVLNLVVDRWLEKREQDAVTAPELPTDRAGDPEVYTMDYIAAHSGTGVLDRKQNTPRPTSTDADIQGANGDPH